MLTAFDLPLLCRDILKRCQRKNTLFECGRFGNGKRAVQLGNGMGLGSSILNYHLFAHELALLQPVERRDRRIDIVKYHMCLAPHPLVFHRHNVENVSVRAESHVQVPFEVRFSAFVGEVFHVERWRWGGFVAIGLGLFRRPLALHKSRFSFGLAHADMLMVVKKSCMISE